MRTRRIIPRYASRTDVGFRTGPTSLLCQFQTLPTPVTESGQANYFFGYTEFVRRKSVLKRADEILTDFNQLANLVDLT